MSKKSNAIEVLKPVHPVPISRAQFDEAIEQKVAEIIGADKTGIFEPFFQRKAIAREIRKLQTLPQQRKWHDYFDEWGCLVCEKKDGRYAAVGMCATCHFRTKMRLQTILRFTERERSDAPPVARDLHELARATVRPRDLLVAAELEPLEVETRDYITKAERRAQQKAQRQRGAATREKRTVRAETLRQAVEQGLTAKEIAERYDPDFLKNPEAATQRIQAAVYRYVPSAVRAQRKHERSARLAERWRKARNLHDGRHGLTWREITKRLDPAGFAENPKAAMARIITGSRGVSMVRDLTDLARATVRRRP